MKKIFLSVILTLFAVSLYAGGPSCAVPNSGGKVVSLVQTSDTSDAYGNLYVSLKVTKNQTTYRGYVTALVMVYDPMDNRYPVTSITVDVPNDGTPATKKIPERLNPHKAYYFEIHSASCE